MRGKYFWIKERHNPQLGIYYAGYGQISVKEAEAMGNAIYGYNIMHRYSTAEEYKIALEKFKRIKGE
jgi:hypothetical protein